MLSMSGEGHYIYYVPSSICWDPEGVALQVQILFILLQFNSYLTTYSIWSAMHELSLLLKLPSLFAAWLLWTFHTKSHNMKALVILSHLWSPFLPLTCLYGKKELLGVSRRPSGVFSWEKTPPRLPMQITWPWPPLGRFSHGLITIRKKWMWTQSC